jgi:hypothetical protein
MQAQTETGRRLVLAVIVATLTLEVLAIVAFNTVQGPQSLPQQIVRFFLTVGLCVFLYRGANWARWVAGILYALGGLGSLVGGVATLTTTMAGLGLLIMGIVYVASAVILFFVPTVRAFFGAGKATAA